MVCFGLDARCADQVTSGTWPIAACLLPKGPYPPGTSPPCCPPAALSASLRGCFPRRPALLAPHGAPRVALMPAQQSEPRQRSTSIPQGGPSFIIAPCGPSSALSAPRVLREGLVPARAEPAEQSEAPHPHAWLDFGRGRVLDGCRLPGSWQRARQSSANLSGGALIAGAMRGRQSTSPSQEIAVL